MVFSVTLCLIDLVSTLNVVNRLHELMAATSALTGTPFTRVAAAKRAPGEGKEYTSNWYKPNWVL